MSPPRYRLEALGLILLSAAAQFGWQAAPVPNRGDVWTASQGAYSALLILAVANAYRSRSMMAAAALAFTWQAVTSWCSVLYLLHPWIPTSGSRCSAALDFPVGVLAAASALVLVWRIYVEGDRDGG